MGLRQGFYCCEGAPWQAIVIKEKLQLGVGYSFRGLFHYHHDKKNDDTLADMVLKKEYPNVEDPSVLHRNQQAEWRQRTTGPGFCFWNPKAHFQWYASSSKVTATLTRLHIPIF